MARASMVPNSMNSVRGRSDPKSGFDGSQDLHRHDPIAPEFEEVVVNTNSIHSEDLRPDFGDSLLGVRKRGSVALFKPGTTHTSVRSSDSWPPGFSHPSSPSPTASGLRSLQTSGSRKDCNSPQKGDICPTHFPSPLEASVADEQTPGFVQLVCGASLVVPGGPSANFF